MLDRAATETQITHRQRLWLYVLGGAILVFLALPSLLVIPLSFSDTRFLQFPPPAYSTRWYEAYFGSREWRQATWVSFAAAIVTTGVSTILGTLAAYALHSMYGRAARIIYACFMLPLIVPAILVAIGMFLFYAQLGLNNTMTGIVLAHSVMATPLVVITVASGLKSYDMNQEMVALPQIKLPVITAALLAFITSLDEVTISLFVAGGDYATMTKRMFNALRDEIDPTIAAISTLLIVFSVALLAANQLASAPRRR
jgi:putative spermidine/putrescine transport system permease protein